METKPNPRWWHSLIQKIAASSFGSCLLAGTLHKLDRPFLRLSNDRFSLTGILARLPVIVLTTTGARSGIQRRTPLAVIFDDEKIILIASSFGSSHHPAWYYNLKANPKVRVKIHGEEREHLAREAEGEERQRYWDQAVELYKGYENYRKKAGSRVIPVIVLAPVTGLLVEKKHAENSSIPKKD
ncbi:MAG: nitroreductase family deazaflavin-dependent oxidoreductase [Anaerolineales bacterium]|jgi:deazaflavin-dependent oxidoreductase (nitroreductase family)